MAHRAAKTDSSRHPEGSPSEMDDSDLTQILARALEIQAEGGEVRPEELCAGRPDLIAELSELLGMASSLSTTTGGAGSKRSVRSGMVGRLLDDRYRLTRRLGAGAMGSVFLAEDTQLGREVAIKLLHEHLLGGRDAVERFRREAEILASLRHPGIVTVFDRGQAEEGRYLALEYLEGESLADLVEVAAKQVANPELVEDRHLRRWLGAEAVREESYLRASVRWALEVAEALDAAHAAGVYHRDVKPSNVFVRKSGAAVLLDFGIAWQGEDATLTREGTTLGTPAYIAPETLESASTVDARVDVYGLAATLFTLVTLRAPYQGTPNQVLLAVSTQEPPRAASLRPGLHRDLAAILERGMARVPSDRYDSMRGLAEDLRAFLEHRTVEARASSFVERWLRRAKRSTLAQGAAALLLVGAGLWAWNERADYLRELRADRFAEAWAEVPGNLGLGSLPLRYVEDPITRARIQTSLDDAVSADPGQLQARLVRAAFALDHGDLEQAARQMEEVAQAVGQPLSLIHI